MLSAESMTWPSCSRRKARQHKRLRFLLTRIIRCSSCTCSLPVNFLSATSHLQAPGRGAGRPVSCMAKPPNAQTAAPASLGLAAGNECNAPSLSDTLQVRRKRPRAAESGNELTAQSNAWRSCQDARAAPATQAQLQRHGTWNLNDSTWQYWPSSLMPDRPPWA